MSQEVKVHLLSFNKVARKVVKSIKVVARLGTFDTFKLITYQPNVTQFTTILPTAVLRAVILALIGVVLLFY